MARPLPRRVEPDAPHQAPQPAVFSAFGDDRAPAPRRPAALMPTEPPRKVIFRDWAAI